MEFYRREPNILFPGITGQQLPSRQNYIFTIRRQVICEGSSQADGNFSRRGNRQNIGDIGEGHNGIKLMIPISASPDDVQCQIYLGMGPLRYEHLISRLSAPSCFPQAW